MDRMTVKLVVIFSILLLAGACANVRQDMLGDVVGGVVMEKAHRAYDRKDYATALANYRRAAEYGNTEAQYFLAQMYAKGQGTAKNRSKAVMWMQKSADSGFAPAQVALGLWYQFGSGVPPDPRRAYALFLEAAEAGNADAQYFVAVLSATGHGTAKNKKEALRWFRLAKSNGFPVPHALLTSKGITALGNRQWAGVVSSGSSAGAQHRAMVRQIQRGLKRLGYQPGPVDGMYGRKTRTAIESFQRQKGLAVDGRATRALLKVIEAEK